MYHAANTQTPMAVTTITTMNELFAVTFSVGWGVLVWVVVVG